ncbi:MAG: Trm112 family protein [Gammaproteobacteria bacterium]|jgi:hypothetical protein|tara:strand:+ start:19630 stop:19812 length:183 start_codon:yes stop_codon:yes gene_type:complete
MIDKKLLDILVCPKSKSSLKLVGNELLSFDSKLAYPIRDGIPVMLETEARKLDDTELENN